jgi:hypothetical protein
MYKVRFYEGDYLKRQQKANEDDCVCYVEQHFNWSSSPSANYAVVVTGYNASQTSKNWGRWYANAVAREFDIPISGDRGILVGGFNGWGDFNLRFTEMPAILLEPLFCSNPQQAEWIRSDEMQNRLARVLGESIQRFFPGGGLVAFSVGHKYKKSHPNDRGAKVYGGGVEADYAEEVLKKAKIMLEDIDKPVEDREIKVVRGDEVLWKQSVDPDSDILWDPVRGVLRIKD